MYLCVSVLCKRSTAKSIALRVLRFGTNTRGCSLRSELFKFGILEISHRDLLADEKEYFFVFIQELPSVTENKKVITIVVPILV